MHEHGTTGLFGGLTDRYIVASLGDSQRTLPKPQ